MSTEAIKINGYLQEGREREGGESCYLRTPRFCFSV
jgi:hypothetical protein